MAVVERGVVVPAGEGVGEGGGSGGPAERAEVEKAGKKAGAYRLEDTRLDGKLPAWPAEPPTAAKNNLERTRLALDRVARRGAHGSAGASRTWAGPQPWRPPSPGPSRPSCTRGRLASSRPGPTSTPRRASGGWQPATWRARPTWPLEG